jgi:tetratricopeptide (TPR) repeat protein
MKAGRFEEAVDLMKSRLASDSGPTASMEFMAALSLIKLNRPADALPHIASCIEKLDWSTMTPACHELRKGAPYQLMAETLIKTGNGNKAEDYFKRALALDPHSALVVHDYAYFLHQQNRSLEALQTLQQGMANGINDERIWHLGSFVSNSKPDFIEFAVDWTTEALKFWPENEAIQGLHAEALLKSGQFEKAMPFYERLSQSSNVAAQAALILCQMCLERKLSPVSMDQETRASLEFMGWYKRLVMSQAKAALTKVNANLAALKTVLPSAATTLEKALAEAKAME